MPSEEGLQPREGARGQQVPFEQVFGRLGKPEHLLRQLLSSFRALQGGSAHNALQLLHSQTVLSFGLSVST